MGQAAWRYWAGAIGGLVVARAGLRRLFAYDLKNKVVLITGGSRGLGLALAREFGACGAKVAICARSEEELSRAQANLERQGYPALTLRCDVSDREQVKRLVADVTEQLGPVDVLVNNAGVIQMGPFEEMTFDDFHEAMGVHFWAPLYATWAVLPSMRERRTGRIVNISSIGGKVSVPHLSPYCVSKFALTGLSEGLRAELAREGIRVTTVCPGLMRTGSPPNAFFKGQHRSEYAWFILAASLPTFSLSVRRAARQIVQACRLGKAEVVLSTQAKVMTRLYGLFAGPMTDLFGLVNQLLPAPGGVGTQRVPGRESEGRLTRSWLTGLTRRAAREYNELPAVPAPAT